MENFHHKCPTVLIPGFSGFSGSGSRVWVQVLEVALFRNKLKQKKQFTWHLGKKTTTKKQKKLLFLQMPVTKKIFNQVAANLFF